MNYPFELVENTPEQVIIKNLAKNPIDVAKHPYVAGNYEYITVTKGNTHILTVIKSDGKTFSFNWGFGGYTLISEGLECLRKKVIEFIEKECRISLNAR